MALNIPKVPQQLPISAEVPSDSTELQGFLRQLIEVLQQQNSAVANQLNGGYNADVLANRSSNPSPGSTFYATDNGHFYVFDGTNWNTLV